MPKSCTSCQSAGFYNIRCHMHTRFLRLTLLVALLHLVRPALPCLRADDFRVLPAGQLPDDARLGPLKNLNGYFPFTPYTSKDAWEKRAAELRHQILVAAGLWPM